MARRHNGYRDSNLRSLTFSMDSRIVNREIRREVWPALRAQGFQNVTSRRAFRHSPERIWVVDFQSFNSYFSLVDGCTTFSFAVNLAIYIPALADERETPPAKPHDYDCHLRRKLSKDIQQLNYPRKDIWFVEPSGENLLDVLGDARSVILRDGISWFHRFDNDNEVFRTLTDDDEDEALFGIGSRWSTRRKVLIGRFAVAIGQEELGQRVLREGEAEMRSIRLQVESLGRNRRRPGGNS
jgi:hypothetical protein